MSTNLHTLDQLDNVGDRLRTIWLALNAIDALSDDFILSVSNALNEALKDFDEVRDALMQGKTDRAPDVAVKTATAPAGDRDALSDAANEVDYRLSHIGTALDAIDDLHDDLKGAAALPKLEGLLSIIKDQRTSAVAEVAKIFAARHGVRKRRSA